MPSGFTVLCTSRPEGATLEAFHGFDVLELQPLTVAQQREVVVMQLSLLQLNVSFVDHLLAFADLRQQHDQIYVQRAFPSEVRRRIDSMSLRPAAIVLASRFCSMSDSLCLMAVKSGLSCGASLMHSLS